MGRCYREEEHRVATTENKQRPSDPATDNSGNGPWKVEGLPPAEDGADGKSPPSSNRRTRSRFIAVLLGLLVLNWLVYQVLSEDAPSRLDVPYTTFRGEVQGGNVAEVTSRGDRIQGEFRNPVTYPLEDGESSVRFETQRPTFAEDDGLLDLLVDQGVVVNATPPDAPAPLWQSLVFGFGPTILLVGLFIFFMRRSAMGGIGGIGRSKAKLADPTVKRTTFEDVAGIDDAEDELREIVDFLRNPDRYRRLGAAIPKGVLLSGLPGTGKTLLARAVAGEAGVPFFSMSASEFVEMIVGVGASRVRDLFETAKKAAPAIIFIDEMDAIGRSRASGMSMGGHDEREQTLNQILTEMDGFTGSEGVIVLAATNRPEILDQALLRPGRFDRRVVVSPPDLKGRLAILEVHTRNVPLGPDVELHAIAASTPGFVGADLRNLVNEAALMGARRNREQVQMGDFTDAFEKVVLGTARNIALSQEVKERTAYHESGHALLGMLIAGADPVRKISIIPRGMALGVTIQSPDADRYDYDAAYLKGKIVGLLGGRAAEEVVYGDVTTGAESDLEKVTDIARRMVGRWGMSDAIGPIAVLPGPNDDSKGMLFPGVDHVAPRTRELVDAEVRRIVEECYNEALQRLADNRPRLDSLAHALLERETLDEPDIYQAVGIDRPRRAVATA
ncbi:MAG: ATP-dependent zinc metalloprotease FtsH [Acidimicrobiia bacterium]|nr:ATP-dependent zinc metalloprotease FtsH [Acidimicrobiia bacterium]